MGFFFSFFLLLLPYIRVEPSKRNQRKIGDVMYFPLPQICIVIIHLRSECEKVGYLNQNHWEAKGGFVDGLFNNQNANKSQQYICFTLHSGTLLTFCTNTQSYVRHMACHCHTNSPCKIKSLRSF